MNEVIKFINAQRISLVEVRANYESSTHGKFSVFWNCVHDGTGKVSLDSYDLKMNFETEDEEMYERLHQAVSGGEADNNSEIDLYLTIRDTFSSSDCEDFEINYNYFQITDIQFFDYTSKELTKDDEVVEIMEYSANIAINDLFLIQACGGKRIATELSIPSPTEAHWNGEDNQRWAKYHIDIEILEEILMSNGFENSFEWLKENSTEVH